jgi:hypothetical protein
MQQQPKIKFEYLYQPSFLAFVKNSVGTKMFQTFYVKKEGKTFDVLRKGKLSCSVFASFALKMFGLIDKMHFTTPRTAEDLLASGAKKIPLNKIQPGDVIIWVPLKSALGVHNHIGFYVGNKQAVSNSDKKLMVVKHHYLFKGKRDIEMILRPLWKK